MKTTSILLALTAAIGVFAAPENEKRTNDYNPYEPKCHADNCLRGIRGKHNYYPPLAERYEDCKKYQVTVVKTHYPPVTKTWTKTVTITPKPYCPPKHHYDPKPPKKHHDHDHDDDDEYGPPKKHYNREASPEAEAGAEPEAEANPTYEPPSYYPPSVPAYATYCKTPDRYASACACVGYPKTTKTITLPGKTHHTKAYATVTAKPPPCPKKHHYEPKPKPTYEPHY